MFLPLHPHLWCAGVFNVVTGGGAMGQLLAEHHLVDKVAFTGSTEIGKVSQALE